MREGSWPADVRDLLELQGATADRLGLWPTPLLREFLLFRLAFLEEELRETREATSAAEVVDGLVDLCVVAIGTLLALGVDAQEAWRRVHEANMAKTPGVNPTRANPFGLPDLVKPAGWQAPRHDDNTGLVSLVYQQEVV